MRHLQHKCTVLGKRVFHDEAKKYGCLVADPATKEILHWAEKPETFVSDIINCGVYLFDVSLMDTIVNMEDKISQQRLRSESNSEANTQHDFKKLFPEFSNLDNLRCVNCLMVCGPATRRLIHFCMFCGMKDWRKMFCYLLLINTVSICTNSATLVPNQDARNGHHMLGALHAAVPVYRPWRSKRNRREVVADYRRKCGSGFLGKRTSDGEAGPERDAVLR